MFYLDGSPWARVRLFVGVFWKSLNMFGFFLLFVSTGLTVCYSFRLFYFVLCGDFNSVPSYSTVETDYNMITSMVGLLVMSIFGGGSLIWLICPTPSVICLPYYLRFLTLVFRTEFLVSDCNVATCWKAPCCRNNCIAR